METVDIYTADGLRTGKAVVRGTPLADDEYRLLTGVWVLDGNGRTLLQQRQSTKSYCPDLWEVPGGTVQAGEDSRTAAVRELAAETGIQARALTLLGRITYTGTEGFHCLFDCYLYRCAETPAVTLQTEEVADYLWIMPQQLERRLSAPDTEPITRQIWQRWQAEISR